MHENITKLLQYTTKRAKFLTIVEISFTYGYPQAKLWITFSQGPVFPRKWGKISVFKAFFVDNSVDNVEKCAWEKRCPQRIGSVQRMQNVGKKVKKSGREGKNRRILCRITHAAGRKVFPKRNVEKSVTEKFTFF